MARSDTQSDPTTDAPANRPAIEPMPWMMALRMECLKIARDTARYKQLDALEPEAERYVNWVLGTPTPPKPPV